MQKSAILHISELSTVVKSRRKSLGINQEQLADLANVGLRTIKGLEAGRSNPTLQTMEAILDVLGLALMIKTKK